MRSTFEFRKIVPFLAITFTITWIVEFAMMMRGFNLSSVPPMIAQFAVMAVMIVPALSALITVRFINKEGFKCLNIRIGSWQPYFITLILVPLIFLLIHLITWIFKLGSPDWQLVSFFELIKTAGGDITTVPKPSFVLAVLFAASFFITPFFNGIWGFGEELGWRGYLLPNLLPLGKFKAYALLGVIWALWHAPLIFMGFRYGNQPLYGLLVFTLLLIAISIYMNEMTIRYKSSILAGFIHGALNAQFYGIWMPLFPNVNPLIGGSAGLIAVLVWMIVGFITIRINAGYQSSANSS
jgi:hypothetical protein